MITNKNEAKTITKHISCDFNANCTTCDPSQIWNNKTCQYKCKNYGTCKKDYNLNPSKRTCENSKYLRWLAWLIQNQNWFYYNLIIQIK